ncbi:MAG: hypothetical protein U0176_05050 [Bacteroidia bacterium]
MRSLLELAEGRIGKEKMGQKINNGPCMEPDSNGGKLFGTISDDDKVPQRASRILVRDGMLLTVEDFKHSDLYFAQAKTEVVLDRS